MRLSESVSKSIAGVQLADQPDDLQPWLLAVAGSGQHQGHQRLVDQHRVGLVDQGHVRVGRHQIVDIGHQLIAQHVEADLVDRRVGDVALVGRAALVGGRFAGDPADRDAERLQQWTHPFGIAAGQVVVDRDDVNVPSTQRVAGSGDGSGQGLALTGCHFDHVAGQHPQRAEQLHIERPQPGGPFTGFSGDGQELRDVVGLGQVVEVEQAGGFAQLFVVEPRGLLVVLGRRRDLGQRAALVLLGAGAEQSPEAAAQAAGRRAGGLWHRSTVPAAGDDAGPDALRRRRYMKF